MNVNHVRIIILVLSVPLLLLLVDALAEYEIRTREAQSSQFVPVLKVKRTIWDAESAAWAVVGQKRLTDPAGCEELPPLLQETDEVSVPQGVVDAYRYECRRLAELCRREPERKPKRRMTSPRRSLPPPSCGSASQ